MEFLSYCPIVYAENEVEKLRLFRKHRGLTTRDIERMLSLPKNSVYRVENLGQYKYGSIEKLWNYYRA